ncbi:hypothetical protein ACFOSC_12195 [Streptantibioticus rubrisoli]|uniref:MYXO-CTERM domain-containing protein n=1 Tax=Streptantibioticus rubrisoli TaxID=1387313 RepID=A0ABT1P8A9_9ACTN|nr:hypothetical protein [Streptantibioticus rubrisoli]MCQ4041607.1 hypothetical protein [Streptantibioticus rubrisoli]
MPSGRILTVTLAAVAALGLTAPAARASVSPDPVSPGQRLRLTDDGRCDMSMGAKASSPLFGEADLAAGADRMVAGVTAAPTASPGTYGVTIRCGAGGTPLTATVRVRATPSAEPSKGAQAGTGTPGAGAPQLACGTALLGFALTALRRRRHR